MKHLLSLAAALLFSWSALAQITTTFNVDMTCAPSDFENVFVTGPWCGWCANEEYNTMTDPDGDGIYSVGLFIEGLTAGQQVEYKYAINGFADQENLVNDMNEGASCAPITDNNSYANRLTDPGSTTNDSYGTCDGTCNDVPPAPGGTILFRVDMSEYEGSFGAVNLNGSFNGWCGSCAPMFDDDQDMVYELAVDLPGGTIEYKFTLDGWTVEEVFTDGDACTSTIDGYVNRTFDVTEEDANLDAVCWNSCSACLPDCPELPAFDFTVTDAECHEGTGLLTLDEESDTLTYAVEGEALVDGMIELSAGQYVLTATASDGCSADTLIEIGAPAAISIDASIDAGDSGMGDGQANVEVSGGTPFMGDTSYVVVFTDADNAIASSDSLAAGEYTITVTDSLGCEAMTTFEMTIQIFGCTDPDACNYDPAATDSSGCIVGPGPAAGFLAMDALCFDGAGSVMLDSLTASDSSNVFMVGDSLLGVEALTLLPGEYSISGMDANGCTSDTTFVISAPDTLTVEVTLDAEATASAAGQASAMADGGTPEYTYAWTNMTGQTVSPDSLSGGLYTVTVTDANGCTANASLTMTVDGLSEMSALQGALFPVPVRDELNIRLAAPLTGDALITVRDSQGRVVMATQMRQHEQRLTLDATSWTSGIYTLQLNTAEAAASWKFVK